MKGIQGTSNKTYRQLMANGLRYEVPKFQRDYSWEEEQWDDLWQDIKTTLADEENEHYMGYLVLQTTNNREFTIIDGQQRLTTLSILILATLKCLKDLSTNGIDSKKNEKRYENLMNSYIGYIDPITLITQNKLKLNRNSDDYYKEIVRLNIPLPQRGINVSEKHLRKCFYWYYEKIKKDYITGESLASFIDQIVDKLYFTVIEVSDQINAFKVFETLNARGVQLSAADLLKNYLFSVVDETSPHITEIEELEKLWSRIIEKLGENKLEEYLRYYWNSFNRLIGKKDLFKTIRNSIKTKQQVFELVRALNDTADIYLALQDPHDELWRHRPNIAKALYELNLFQIKQTLSLFITAYKNLPDDKFEQLLKICSVISFRYNVIGGLNPNLQEDVYNKITLSIARESQFNINDFSQIYVNDSSFEDDFKTKEFKNTTRNHRIVKYIFSNLERYLYHNEIDPGWIKIIF